MIWGVERIDRKGVGAWDSSNPGTVIWDMNFKLRKEES